MTSMTESGAEAVLILKRDKLGRIRTTEARREEILAEFEKSGMSGQAFAKWVGVIYLV